MVNSKRPQTSYGGISARQKSLQKALRQKSSKVAYNGENKFEELFPGPSNADINLNPNSNYIADNTNKFAYSGSTRGPGACA